jgi:hypothetical protein
VDLLGEFAAWRGRGSYCRNNFPLTLHNVPGHGGDTRGRGVIIVPEIFGHYKFTHLKKRVGDLAFEYLGRLWGHCEGNVKRGSVWKNCTPLKVELICCWNGEEGKLYAALVEARWIDERDVEEGKDERTVIIHDWDYNNAGLLASWKNGVMGGRPKKPKGNPPKTHGLPNGYPAVSHGQPTDNPPLTHGEPSSIPIDRERDREIESERAREVDSAEIPTPEEIVTFGAMNSGIPPDYCLHYHERRTIGKSWLTKHGELIDWRRDIVSRSWWGKDRSTWKPQEPVLPSEIQKINAELHWQTDGARIAALHARRRALDPTAL